MHSRLWELGAAGYIPAFETYQLLFIHPFVSVCNSACLSFFVSPSSQTVPRIRIAEASDLLQSYLFNEMRALLPYVPKGLLSGRKNPAIPLPSGRIVPSAFAALVSNVGNKGLPAPSTPPPAQTLLFYFAPAFTPKTIIFRLGSLLAPFPPPGTAHGRPCPPPATELGTDRVPASRGGSPGCKPSSALPAPPHPPTPAGGMAGSGMAGGLTADTLPPPAAAAGCSRHGRAAGPTATAPRGRARCPQSPARSPATARARARTHRRGCACASPPTLPRACGTAPARTRAWRRGALPGGGPVRALPIPPPSRPRQPARRGVRRNARGSAGGRGAARGGPFTGSCCKAAAREACDRLACQPGGRAVARARVVARAPPPPGSRRLTGAEARAVPGRDAAGAESVEPGTSRGPPQPGALCVGSNFPIFCCLTVVYSEQEFGQQSEPTRTWGCVKLKMILHHFA